MFSLRIFTINYYISKPHSQFDEIYSDFRQSEIKEVPILRVFGSTPEGKKACLHVHNVYPYILIRCLKEENQIHKFMYDLSNAIDRVLNISLGCKDPTHASQHVYKISIIKAKSMYGYYEQDSIFLKIFIYRPDLIKRLADLLVDGAIMSETFQPFNAHVPYNLQFLIDYNLFGMNYIHLNSIVLRKFSQDLFFKQDQSEINLSSDDSTNEILHQSLCKIELDCVNSDILNPSLQKNSKILNPGLDALWNDEKKRRSLFNLPPCTSPPETQDRSDMHNQEVEAAFRQRLVQLLEDRFQMKYPFKSLPNDTTLNQTISGMNQLTNQDDNQIDDNEMVNILDALHNEFDEDEQEIGQLRDDFNDEDDDEQRIQEENNHLTQIVPNQMQANETENNENLDLLNASQASSNEEEENTKKIDNDEDSDTYSSDDDRHDEIRLTEASVSILPNNQLDQSTTKKAQKFKFKGTRQMIVRVNKLDLNSIRSKCNYYKSNRHNFNNCNHLRSKTSQKSCWNCDFSSFYTDSLSYMTYESPVKMRRFSIPYFIEEDSPTMQSDAENSIIDETLVHDSSFSQSKYDTDSDTLSEISICASFASDLCINDNENENLDEFLLKSKIHNSQSSFKQDETVQEVQERFEKIETWTCTNEFPPFEHELDEIKSGKKQDEIVCYKTSSTKQWKLNINEFETKFKSSIKFCIEEKDLKASHWFTPAIPFPSFRTKRRKKKVTPRRTKKITEFDEQSIKSSLMDNLSTTHSVHSDAIDSNSNSSFTTNTTTTTKNIDEQSNEFNDEFNKTIVPKKAKRKSVRFSELITLNEENDSSETKLAKGHLIDSSYFQGEHHMQIEKRDISCIDETIMLEDTQGDLDASRASFYEYKSILFPSDCTRLMDSFTCTQDLTTTLIEPRLMSLDDCNNYKLKNQPIDKEITLNECNHLKLLSLEVYANNRHDLVPNPCIDSIGFVCYTIYEQRKNERYSDGRENYLNFMILFDGERRSLATRRFVCTLAHEIQFENIQYVYREEDLFYFLIKEIQHYDPDILVGYEIQKQSWCFLSQRAEKLGIKHFAPLISRIPKCTDESRCLIAKTTRNDDYLVPKDIRIGGRLVLNLWRILKSEISLHSYTFENCCYHILHERAPKYAHSLLTQWYQSRTDLHRWKVIRYYAYRAETNLRLINKLNLLDKTSEFSRVYGIEFYHVLSRGSQYRVESMMLRTAKSLGFLPVSPSLQQKAKMRASECIPLTLEPESAFHTQPMAILDFQSLYPSVIIAFNICYTTCLGRIESIGKEGCFKFGCVSLFISDDLIKKLDLTKDVYIAPNGVAFVKPHIRKGVLPIMLEEILNTRVMVKSSMKLYKDENLLKVLDSRQLSLKLIANVTYGYTAANYSGRMPCMEVGDSIVRQGRQILEDSIKFIHANFAKFHGRVVYGDTDSMFILFENLSKEKAFENSLKIVADISNKYEKPIKLKFEKVYLPSVLLAKKRYVGNMFETLDQHEGILDAKGIEIIRRDGCQIASKILERSLRVLFEFKEAQKVKNYVLKYCQRLVQGKINIKEFLIAKEYRGKETYSNMKSIAACQITNRLLKSDPLAEPLVGERVPYIIVYGPPGLPLYELVRSPNELLKNDDLKLNYEYYIMKQILPPLDRIFSLMHVNVFEWVSQMSFRPKLFHKSQFDTTQNCETSNHASINFDGLKTLTNYFYATACLLCGTKCDLTTKETNVCVNKKGLCDKCALFNDDAIIKLKLKFKRAEKRYDQLMSVCKWCTSNANYGHSHTLECSSFDCPNLYLCSTHKNDFSKIDYLRKIIDYYFI